MGNAPSSLLDNQRADPSRRLPMVTLDQGFWREQRPPQDTPALNMYKGKGATVSQQPGEEGHGHSWLSRGSHQVSLGFCAQPHTLIRLPKLLLVPHFRSHQERKHNQTISLSLG